MQEIAITTPTINLDQFLKWAGIIETGGQIQGLLSEQLILVNGIIAVERRKKLRPGDIVEIKGLGAWKVIAE